MKLAVTISRDEDVQEIKPLIEEARLRFTLENVTVLEAPSGIRYSYPFPVVTVNDGADLMRHFGSEALEALRDILKR